MTSRDPATRAELRTLIQAARELARKPWSEIDKLSWEDGQDMQAVGMQIAALGTLKVNKSMNQHRSGLGIRTEGNK